jgi:hypothetical protein
MAWEMEMRVADIALSPWVWNVPRGNFSFVEKLSRKIYCARHADKLKMFFLGVLAADKEMSDEDKVGYHAWLLDLDWSQLLSSTYDVAVWKRHVDRKENPIDAALFDGANSEYRRLFRCYKDGYPPRGTGIV